MNFLAGIGARAWGYVIVALAVVGAFFATFRKGQQTGRNEVIVKTQDETAEARERMLRSAITSPTEKSGVAEAARNKRF